MCFYFYFCFLCFLHTNLFFCSFCFFVLFCFFDLFFKFIHFFSTFLCFTFLPFLSLSVASITTNLQTQLFMHRELHFTIIHCYEILEYMLVTVLIHMTSLHCKFTILTHITLRKFNLLTLRKLTDCNFMHVTLIRFVIFHHKM